MFGWMLSLRVDVNISMSTWKPLMSAVPICFLLRVLKLALFNIVIGKVRSGTESTLSKFAFDTKMSDAFDTL